MNAAAAAAGAIVALMDRRTRDYLRDNAGNDPSEELLKDCGWPDDLAQRLGALLDKHNTAR